MVMQWSEQEGVGIKDGGRQTIRSLDQTAKKRKSFG